MKNYKIQRCGRYNLLMVWKADRGLSRVDGRPIGAGWHWIAAVLASDKR